MNTQAIRTLKATKKLLIDKGWCQGIREDYKGRHCALGALGVAKCQNAQAYPSSIGPAYEFLRKAIGYDSVAIWNDSPRTTLAVVLEAFGDAIQLARKKKVKQ